MAAGSPAAKTGSAVGAARPGSAVADHELGLVRQAMAYRVKYRVAGGKRQMYLSLLGVHPLNRGGVYPSPETVQNLGLKLLQTGFSEDEANHEGVCVQEIPAEERSCDPRAKEKPYETYQAFNSSHCDSAPQLRDCFSRNSDVLYGTLSHSHLLLCLLAMKNGAKWEWPPDWGEVFEKGAQSGGTPDFAAVAALDPSLATLLRDGVRMEVLSWKIYEEEPSACSLISQALNSGQQLALQTSELTALAVLTGSVTLELESAVAGCVSFETVKAKVRHELDMYVDQAEFIDLFDFVVSMGAGKNSFIKLSLEFGSMFVDQKQRQLRLCAFAEVNKMPLDTPRCKIAVLMRAYRKPPSRTWCPTPEAAWGRSARRSSGKEMLCINYVKTCLGEKDEQ